MPYDQDEDLAHYGVRGMKWGVRRGNLKSRVAGAQKDFVQRGTSANKRMQGGRKQMTLGEKLALGPVRVAVGSKRFNEIAKKGGTRWAEMGDRLDKGKSTLDDKLLYAQQIPLTDLIFTKTEYLK